jgi:dimethylargininase
MRLAITREVSRAIGRCELTHLERRPIDLARARLQHAAYEAALEEAGCALLRLPEEPDLPDSVFVEDTAVILPGLAILTRPGSASRRPEVESVAKALQPLRSIARLEEPATLDGGDVLLSGRKIFVGLSSRTNPEGVERLRALAAPLGYEVTGVAVAGCLHLKSAATEVAPGLLLVNSGWVDPACFAGLSTLDVDPEEPGGANALRIGDDLLYSPAFPATLRRLKAAGLRVRPVDLSELAKAEGALTCCSLIVEA